MCGAQSWMLETQHPATHQLPHWALAGGQKGGTGSVLTAAVGAGESIALGSCFFPDLSLSSSTAGIIRAFREGPSGQWFTQGPTGFRATLSARAVLGCKDILKSLSHRNAELELRRWGLGKGAEWPVLSMLAMARVGAYGI